MKFDLGTWLSKAKRGMGIGDLIPAVMTFVIIGLVAGAGALALAAFQNQTNQTLYPTAYTVQSNALSGISTFSSWLNTIATIIAASILVTIVLGVFGYLNPAGGRAGGAR